MWRWYTSCRFHCLAFTQIAVFVRGRRLTLPRGKLSVVAPTTDKLLSRWKCVCVFKTVAWQAAVVSQIWEPFVMPFTFHIDPTKVLDIRKRILKKNRSKKKMFDKRVKNNSMKIFENKVTTVSAPKMEGVVVALSLHWKTCVPLWTS